MPPLVRKTCWLAAVCGTLFALGHFGASGQPQDPLAQLAAVSDATDAEVRVVPGSCAPRGAPPEKSTKTPLKLKLPRLVFPPHERVVLVYAFDVIYQGKGCMPEQFLVDGKPRDWDKFTGDIRAASIRLDPGMHEIAVGKETSRFAVALNELEHDGPSDWKFSRMHELDRGPDRCAACHEAETGARGQVHVGPFLGSKSCLACHEKEDFKIVHSHVLKPLKDCTMCHDMHGAPLNQLLKAPAKQLCESCHPPE